jgi:hypothetical protein
MADITRIDVRIKTGDRPRGGTDGFVTLTIAGRDFSINSRENDFLRGDDVTYTLGERAGEPPAGRAVTNSRNNNPREPQLDTADLDTSPVFIRYAPWPEVQTVPGDFEWDLESIRVTVNPGADAITYSRFFGDNHLWLGRQGSSCYLRREA